MSTRIEVKKSYRALRWMGGVAFLFLAAAGLQAAPLWTNGAVTTSLSGDNRCDSSSCSAGTNPFTIFDNFNIASGSKAWVVTGFDFADFLINGPTSDIAGTRWSIWSGDPLSGGKVIASGTATASLTNISGTCAVNSSCLEMFTINLGSSVTLAAGNTYYLGTSNMFPNGTSSNETTERAFAAGGNTAPGGTANSLHRWEQSNGSTPGTFNSTWTPGTLNTTFPNATLGIVETATAFDINGTLAPEPGSIVLMSIALAGFGYFLRRRTA